MPLPGNPPLVTVFGGGGFIGRYVCEALIKAGVRLRVAERHPRNAYFLQPLGQMGQIALVQADLARLATIERAVDGAAAVINLVGIFKGNLQAIHVDGAGSCRSGGARRGGVLLRPGERDRRRPHGSSEYGRTKGLGEAAVRAGFANATILRPSVVFGAEDDFSNRFAAMAQLPVTPVIAPGVRFQPVFVRDLAAAIAMAALDPQRFGGNCYDIGGPEVLTMRDLNRQVAAMAGLTPAFVEVPDFVAGLIAKMGFLPGAPLTSDQWAMLDQDNVVPEQSAGLEAFGIVPTPLGAVAPEWLGRFIKGGRFAPRATA